MQGFRQKILILVEKSCKIIWKKHNVQRIFAVEFGKEHKVRDKVLQISKICSNFAVDFGNRIRAHGRQIKRKVVGYYPTQWT